MESKKSGTTRLIFGVVDKIWATPVAEYPSMKKSPRLECLGPFESGEAKAAPKVCLPGKPIASLVLNHRVALRRNGVNRA